MELKVRKIGNSLGVILPKQVLEHLKLEEDSTVDVSLLARDVIEMRPHDENFTDFMRIWREVEPKHRNTLRELAK